MHCGLLVIARGAKSGMVYPLHVSHVRDGAVSVILQPCREREMRRVSFADALQDTQTSIEQVDLAVQDMSAYGHVERECSSKTQQIDPPMMEMPPMTEMTDMEFFDMLMSDELQDAQTLVEQGGASYAGFVCTHVWTCRAGFL